MFEFDKSQPLSVNFNRWYDYNTAERESYGEKKYEYLEAVRIFAELFKVAAVDIQDSIELERKKFNYEHICD